MANAAGVTMRGQVAPRAVGLLLGLECTLHPLLTNPRVSRHRGAAARRTGRGDVRPRVQGQGARRRRGGARRAQAAGCSAASITCTSSAIRPTTSPTRRRASTRVRAASAATRSTSRTTSCCRTAVAASSTARSLNYDDGNLDAAGEMLAADHTVVGLGDGGAHVGTICDASFPTTLLTLWGRDRDHGRLPLPFLVQRQTSATRADGRPPRPRRARARLPRRRERDRRRSPHRAAARGSLRPARGRQAVRATRPTATSRRSSPARSPTSTARRPGRCPGGSYAARSRARLEEARDDRRSFRSKPAANGAVTTSATHYVFELTDAHVDELDAALQFAESAVRRRARHHARVVPAADARAGAPAPRP